MGIYNTHSNTSVKEISNSSTIIRRTIKPSIKVNPSADLEVSKFNAAKVIHDHEVKFITSLWEHLRSKIARAPYNEIPSLRNEVDKIFDAMKITKTIDISSLKSMVDEYFAHMERFNELEFSYILSQDQIEKMQELEINLKELMTFKHEAISQITKLEFDLEEVEKELHSLHCKRNKLESSIKETKETLEKNNANVSKIHKKNGIH